MQPAEHDPIPAHALARLEAWEGPLDVAVARIEDELVRLRRQLHQHPEPGWHEVATTRLIAEQLTAAGIAPRVLRTNGGVETGVLADVDVGPVDASTPVIALRADIDALRLQDEKQVAYCSQAPGVMHACGHDAHTAMVLGAAMAAGQAGQALPATAAASGLRLRLIFQPAEELSGGADFMVAHGAVEGVQSVLGVHVDPERAAGQAGIRYGALTANCDEVRILVEGRGGHAARPHHAIDPIAAAAQLLGAFYQLLPRSVDSRSPAVFTVGRIHGGHAANVIPERVELLATLRTAERDTRAVLIERIQQICAANEVSTGARVRVDFDSPLGGVVNDLHVTRLLEACCRRVLGAEGVQIIERPSMGGEDFSAYLEHVPGAQLRLGCAAPGGSAPFLHSPQFDIDERALGFGVRILLRTAVLLSAGGFSDQPESG